MSLRDRYQEYFRPTVQQFDEWWKTGLFVPDANVLLDLYRLKYSASEDLLNIFRALKDRLWVPDQAALEFSRNRVSVINKMKSDFEDLVNLANKFMSEFIKGLNHCYMEKNTDEIRKEIESFKNNIDSKLADRLQKYPKLLNEDPLLEVLNEVLGENIGLPFNEEKIREIYARGAERYANNIPPGYKDAQSKKEDDDRKYGDLVLWEQVIEKAIEVKLPIIIITRDVKDDWYVRQDGLTLGPHVELRKEMMDRANVPYYSYTTDQFMEYASTFLKQTLHPDTLEDVREVAASNLNLVSSSGSNDYKPLFYRHLRSSRKHLLGRLGLTGNERLAEIDLQVLMTHLKKLLPFVPAQALVPIISISQDWRLDNFLDYLIQINQDIRNSMNQLSVSPHDLLEERDNVVDETGNFERPSREEEHRAILATHQWIVRHSPTGTEVSYHASTSMPGVFLQIIPPHGSKTAAFVRLIHEIAPFFKTIHDEISSIQNNWPMPGYERADIFIVVPHKQAVSLATSSILTCQVKRGIRIRVGYIDQDGNLITAEFYEWQPGAH